MNKKFKPIDLLKGLDYSRLDQTDIGLYEQHVVKIMICDNCTMSEALKIDFQMNMLDKDCVFDLVEYLEEKLPALNKVSFYMDIYTGKINDFYLTKE